jgi:hypothetical protein
MFDPDAGMPRLNRSLVYLGACIIAGLRLAREKQVNVRVIPTRPTVQESVDLAHEIFNTVFRKVPERVERSDTAGPDHSWPRHQQPSSRGMAICLAPVVPNQR